jgi:hypothetical protein
VARVYTGSGGYVDVQPVSLAKLLNQIIPATVKGANKAAKQSLFDLRDAVRTGIKGNTLGLDPLKPSTLAARAMGKPAGNFPARNKISSTNPLLASGQTLRGIRVDAAALDLGFDSSATISYTRGNMGKVAEKHEAGFTIRGVYTKKMLAYLAILFKKQFGKRARILGQGHAKVGVAFTRSVAPRPAWERATQKTIKKISNNFAMAIGMEFKNRGLI